VTLLVLFDIDGTLLLSHDDVYVEANREALREVYGVLPEVPDVPGDTALAQTRRALRTVGLDEAAIGIRLEAWCSAFSRRYVELLAQTDTSDWRVAARAAETLAGLERRALLTGNPEAVARARLERIGLDHLFPSGQGAFGCERERRIALFSLARERAGGWPAERTVAVGDTPLDVASAHAAGARCVAVASGAYSRAELRGADAVVDDLAELPGALAKLLTEPPAAD
jgi:phosphoglycolate phosphatase-like HAD superfamily hydrolase